jgi:hypothetical protein
MHTNKRAVRVLADKSSINFVDVDTLGLGLFTFYVLEVDVMQSKERSERREMATTITVPTDPALAEIGVKRLNINLSETAFGELQMLARRTRRSMTELVRLGLGLVKISIQEAARGNKLIVTTADGQPLREIVLPG